LPDDQDHHNVVCFPQTYTNKQQYKVQLLKLAHDIGALNYAFQSKMDRTQNTSKENYMCLALSMTIGEPNEALGNN
jgi:hypothetical protein